MTSVKGVKKRQN